MPAVLRTGYPESGDSSRCSSSRHRRKDWFVHGMANRSSGFHPRAAWPGRKVRQYERYESDRVADRPFALHAEALDRRGRDTRLVSPVRAGVCTRINGRLSPCCIGALPRISARTRHAGRGQDCESRPFPCTARGQYRTVEKLRKRRCFFGLARVLCSACARLTGATARSSRKFPPGVELWVSPLHILPTPCSSRHPGVEGDSHRGGEGGCCGLVGPDRSNDLVPSKRSPRAETVSPASGAVLAKSSTALLTKGALEPGDGIDQPRRTSPGAGNSRGREQAFPGA